MTTRRAVKIGLAVILLAYLGWYAAKTAQDDRRPPLLPLEAAIAQETQAGWRVARPPELPGPYRREGQPNRVRRGEIGSVQIPSPEGMTVVRIGRDDAEQMAVPLETADGKIAVVVLER